jgi:hypothetical protein
MKFDDLYPNQPQDLMQHDVEFEGSSLFKYGEKHPCWNCGELTNWIDILFEANLCSEECERVKWSEYFLASLKNL